METTIESIRKRVATAKGPWFGIAGKEAGVPLAIPLWALKIILTANLDKVTVCDDSCRYVELSGPHCRYFFAEPGNGRTPVAHCAQHISEVQQDQEKWAVRERELRRRKADPAYKALAQGTAKKRKHTLDVAAFWAINRGYRGVNDAISKLERGASHAKSSYDSQLKEYQETIAPEPETESIRQRAFDNSCGDMIWLEAPETAIGPYDARWANPPEDPAIQWRSAKLWAHQAGQELSRVLAEDDPLYRKLRNRAINGARSFTALRSRFVPILGPMEPFSKLPMYEKRMETKDLLISIIRQRTAKRGYFSRSHTWDYNHKRTIAHALADRKEWLAAVSLLEEFKTVLATGELPENMTITNDAVGSAAVEGIATMRQKLEVSK